MDISRRRAGGNRTQYRRTRAYPPCHAYLLRSVPADLPTLQYDPIVTNPPYVDAEDMSDLAERISSRARIGPGIGFLTA